MISFRKNLSPIHVFSHISDIHARMNLSALGYLKVFIALHTPIPKAILAMICLYYSLSLIRNHSLELVKAALQGILTWPWCLQDAG